MIARGAAAVLGVLVVTGAGFFACNAAQTRAPGAPPSVASGVASASATAEAGGPPSFAPEVVRASAAGYAPGEPRAVGAPEGPAARAVLVTLAADGCVRVALHAERLTTVTVRVAGIDRVTPELLPGQSWLSGPLCGRAKDVVSLEVAGGAVTALPFLAKPAP